VAPGWTAADPVVAFASTVAAVDAAAVPAVDVVPEGAAVLVAVAALDAVGAGAGAADAPFAPSPSSRRASIMACTRRFWPPPARAVVPSSSAFLQDVEACRDGLGDAATGPEEAGGDTNVKDHEVNDKDVMDMGNTFRVGAPSTSGRAAFLLSAVRPAALKTFV
jgi:hypothetical protein